MLSATRSGNSASLDIVEKYCILRDLNEQIQVLKNKKILKNKSSKESLNFSGKASLIRSSYLISPPKNGMTESLISSPGYNLSYNIQ